MMVAMTKLALALLVLAGCGDDGSPAPIDAAAGSDAGGSDAPGLDAAGTACTNALYDPCTDNTQCTSGNCRAFNMPAPGIQVCTQACSANTPCPMQNGVAVTCTNAGVCRPAAANACTR